jgi:hypothetical protein
MSPNNGPPTPEELKLARQLLAFLRFAAASGIAVGLFHGEQGVVNSEWPQQEKQDA